MAVTDDRPETSVAPGVQRRIIRVLTATQVLGGIGVATGVAVSTLAAASLSGSDAIGGLAQTSAVLGAALLAVPTARAAARGGRRTALIFAYGCGVLGAVITTIALALGTWPLMLFGLLLFGGGSTANLAARYSATDLSRPGHSARDLSIVVWATTIGSVAGPNLAAPAGRVGTWFGLPDQAGPYALAALAFGLAALGILAGLRPDPLRLAQKLRPAGGPAPDRSLGAAWRTLRASRGGRVAVTAIVVSHTAMVALMSMTPVHLNHGGATVTVVGIVISLHIAGMFALSPLVGWLADQLGHLPVLLLGTVQLIAAAALAGTASAHDVGQLSAGLILLGTGWSCGLVAGSALLTDSIAAEGRPSVQGLSDLLMNGGGALGGVLAGAIVAVWSYAVLAALIAVFVIPMTVVIFLARNTR
ncbi:MFS transporter [Actinomadura scrupuli]|uniref:MFS transporter n=1 Tax=Actinomadura scrupuli TaxID=559629 RepID=UPI003D982023